MNSVVELKGVIYNTCGFGYKGPLSDDWYVSMEVPELKFPSGFSPFVYFETVTLATISALFENNFY